MTKFHVDVVLGTLPPLFPVQLVHTEKFDGFKEASKWANKFKSFLQKQKRSKEYVEPTSAEIRFHGGQHCGISFEGISAVTVLDL
jgi:hypothetical protein